MSRQDYMKPASAYQEPTPRLAPENPAAGPAGGQAMVFTGIHIPFSELVVLLVKLAIAAIPAAIIVGIIGAIIFGAVVGFFGGHGNLGA